MGIFDFLTFGKKEVPKQKQKKQFKAALPSLMRGNFGSYRTKLDSELLTAQHKLVGIARGLEKNNSMMKKYLNMVETNIVGPDGFLLISQAYDLVGNNKKLDIIGNTIIEEHYKNWSQAKYCDVAGKLSFKEAQRLAARTWKRDGEILIRFVIEKASKQNPYGFSIQVLDPQRIEHNLNTTLANGNVIVMGVEMTPYGKPIAYHLRTQDAESRLAVNAIYAGTVERVPSDQILHKFKAISQEQSRGVPEGHSVFEIMIHLEEFLEAALIASKVGAASSLYLEKTENTQLEAIDQIADAVETDEEGVQEFYAEVDPGTIRQLPAGTTLKSFDAHYPEANFSPYVQLMLKMIASGLNVSYFVLANSLEKVNYTSSRTGLLEERDGWKREQSWFIENIMEPIYEKWLEISLLNGAIKFVNGNSIPASKIDKFSNSYRFYGKRWDWVDPLKDTNANILQIANGLTSVTRVLAEKGIEFEDILIEKKKEQELMIAYGILKLDIQPEENPILDPEEEEEEEDLNLDHED